MRLKVNHYFSKNPDLPTTFGVEAILTETVTGLIAAFFAFAGYYYGILGIFLLCTGACLVCVIATTISIYEFIRESYHTKKYDADYKIKQENYQPQGKENE